VAIDTISTIRRSIRRTLAPLASDSSSRFGVEAI
jgi:hypothetical protein